MKNEIIIKNARLHNLKNISLSIPKNQLVVLTGVSGSGKSTLAFDTLHKEGQRQYLESMGMVTDNFNKPEVDSIQGLSPSISIDQHLTNRSPRSTVGTATEVYTYLRVLFARIGQRSCSTCGGIILPTYDASEEWDDEVDEAENSETCSHCKTAVIPLSMSHFSFNKPMGACPTCTRLGVTNDANLNLLLDENLSVLDGGVVRWDKHEIARYQKALQVGATHFGFAFDPAQPIKELEAVQRDLLLYGVHSPRFRRHFPEIEPPETAANGRFEGVVTNLLRRYSENAANAAYREKIEKLLITQTCPDCDGTRLRPESRAVTIASKSIVEVAEMSFIDVAAWLEALPFVVGEEGFTIVEPILIDLRERIRRLVDVGVGYLTLARSSPSLSAGEAQRLRLAALLGSGLTGVLYVLDEPSIGLHARDNAQLIASLKHLRDLENSVLVVEHDREMIEAADFVIDLGPGAGELGGQVVGAYRPSEFLNSFGPNIKSNGKSKKKKAADNSLDEPALQSLTTAYLNGTRSIAIPKTRREGNGTWLRLKGAIGHNLKGQDVALPIGTFICVTGVSGSGKSSLINQTLYPILAEHFHNALTVPLRFDSIEGLENIDKVIDIDQSPIGRTPRSNPATYAGLFGNIRDLFAQLPESKIRGYKPGRFSFNVKGGRCESCKGAGIVKLEMNFLPDVYVECETCSARRYNAETLEVQFKSKNIADILEMTVEEALTFFEHIPKIERKLRTLHSVGLGYIRLGQQATTISGGEAQRVKLAKELSRPGTGRTLYILDEPTTGLHFEDIRHLLAVLQALVRKGNTVLVIEHNMDVIKVADYVVDLGPDGGEAGGHILFSGTPEDLAQSGTSTGVYLAEELARVIYSEDEEDEVDLDSLSSDEEEVEDEPEEEPEETTT